MNRLLQKEEDFCLKQGSVECGSCRAQGSVVWVLFKVSTILRMSDYEEDF